MRSTPLCLALALALTTLGCGDVPDSPAIDAAEIDASTTLPFGELPGAVAASQCGSLFRCCNATELMDRFDGSDPPITTEAECTSSFTALFQSAFGRQMEAIAAGRLLYNGDEAFACLMRIDAAACGMATEVAQDSCNETVFVGTVAVTGMCRSDEECMGASVYCDGGSQTQFGRCTAKPGVGASCTFECVDGAYCDFSSTTCVAKKPNGRACQQSLECTSDYCNGTLCAVEPPTTECDGN